MAAPTALVALLFALAFPAWAETFAAAERAQLAAGAVVVRTREVPDSPWPETTVYRRVRATAAEVIAVYVDFEAQPRWIPGLVATRVLARDVSGAARVFYEYEVAGPNERYTVTVTMRRATDGFVVAWDLVEARYARRLAGELRASETADGTLVAYTTRVDPGPLGVTFGTSGTVARRLAATANALAAHVERLTATAPRRVAALVEALDGMLAGR